MKHKWNLDKQGTKEINSIQEKLWLPSAHFTLASEHMVIPTLSSPSPYKILYMFKILHMDYSISEANYWDKYKQCQLNARE